MKFKTEYSSLVLCDPNLSVELSISLTKKIQCYVGTLVKKKYTNMYIAFVV